MRGLIVLLACALVTACALGRMPGEQRRPAIENLDIWQWNTNNSQNSDNHCAVFHTKSPAWAQIIGCQSFETIDARSPGVTQLVNAHLVGQGCESLCRNGENGEFNCTDTSTSISRPFVRTKRHFMVLDKESRTVWYVPEDYYSDGLSIPNWLVPALAFLGQGTADPKTLPSALSHDRYICLHRAGVRQHQAEMAKRERRRMRLGLGVAGDMMRAIPKRFRNNEDDPRSLRMRRKGCANDSFENTLRAAGNGNYLTRAYRTAVGWANGGLFGYCPTFQYNYLAELESRFYTGETVRAPGQPPLDIGAELRKAMGDCRASEPVTLCVSDRDNLRDILNASFGDHPFFLSQEWRDWTALGEQVLCLEHQATRTVRQAELALLRDRAPGAEEFAAEQRRFGEDEHRCRNYPQIGADTASPWRAGDLWIEMSPVLSCHGPDSARRVIANAQKISDAMAALIRWNQANLTGQFTDENGEEAPPAGLRAARTAEPDAYGRLCPKPLRI
ncbi:MAG: hypothetical protein MI723_09760 [Caulobacterales bacterium]|nr:hypothetical protein [Caulobacterales bacterium]